MTIFYFTFGSGQKYGPGYTKINAEDEMAARVEMHRRFGNRWAFCYNKFEDIHPLDRVNEIIWREPLIITHKEQEYGEKNT